MIVVANGRMNCAVDWIELDCVVEGADRRRAKQRWRRRRGQEARSWMM